MTKVAMTHEEIIRTVENIMCLPEYKMYVALEVFLERLQSEPEPEILQTVTGWAWPEVGSWDDRGHYILELVRPESPWMAAAGGMTPVVVTVTKRGLA